jgi:CBS domain-containing protein
MVSELNDELQRMDELERETDPELQEGVTLASPLSQLSLPEPVIVPVKTPLATVIEKVQQRSVGCVLIVAEERLVGILTERDILLKITGKGLNLKQEVVDDYMTADPETLHPDDPLAYALNKMYVGGFRNVPIVDDHNRPVGLVAIGDIINHLVEYFGDQILNLPPRPQRDALERPEGG